jgi:drug/metabolite transporter (DMT)-like permease
LPGEAKALLAAALWAIAGIIFATQTSRLGPLRLNLIRSVAAAAFICLLLPFAGAGGEMRAVSLATVIAMVGSGILAIGLGDSLFFASLPVLGASLAVPISSAAYPLLTFFVAWVWLDETLTVAVLAGSLLVIVGIFLLLWQTAPVIAPPADVRWHSRLGWRGGVLLLMIAAVFYALSTTWLRAGSSDLGPVSAGAIRAGGTVLFLIPAAMTQRREPAIRPFVWKYLGWAAVAGILAGGIGSLFYIAAVQEAGAGRTAILTSTMPLFTLPLAVLFLRERMTPRIVAGTIACVIGISLIV